MKKFLANLFFKSILQETKNDNYTLGYDIGHNEGYEKGYNTGLQIGESKGEKSGYLEGFDEGSKGGTYINSNGMCISDGKGKFTPVIQRKE